MGGDTGVKGRNVLIRIKSCTSRKKMKGISFTREITLNLQCRNTI